jgi:hypothetical protein
MRTSNSSVADSASSLRLHQLALRPGPRPRARNLPARRLRARRKKPRRTGFDLQGQHFVTPSRRRPGLEPLFRKKAPLVDASPSASLTGSCSRIPTRWQRPTASSGSRPISSEYRQQPQGTACVRPPPAAGAGDLQLGQLAHTGCERCYWLAPDARWKSRGKASPVASARRKYGHAPSCLRLHATSRPHASRCESARDNRTAGRIRNGHRRRSRCRRRDRRCPHSASGSDRSHCGVRSAKLESWNPA